MGQLLVVLAIICLIMPIWDYSHIFVAHPYMEVTGTVLSVQKTRSKLFTALEPSWHFIDDLSVTYAYEVNNKLYEGAQLSLPRLSLFDTSPLSYTDVFKIGQDAHVKFDPTNPGRSVFPNAVWYYFSTDLLEGALLFVCCVVITLMFAVGKAGV